MWGSKRTTAIPLVFDISARIVLFPLLVTQALILRAKALRLPEAAGPRSGQIGSGPALSVLVIGDSSAAGVGVQSQDDALAGQLVKNLARTHTVTWHLHAKTGATTASTVETMRDIPAQRFDVAVQALGVNDVTRGTGLTKWLRLQETVAKQLRDTHGVQHIVVTGVPPMGQFPLLPNPLRWVLGRQADRFDAAQRARCAKAQHLHYISVAFDMDVSAMATDGFHPGPQVYAEWGRIAAQTVTSALMSRTSDSPPAA